MDGQELGTDESQRSAKQNAKSASAPPRTGIPFLDMNLPPLHPAIVHFPIALITLSVIVELIGYFGRNQAARTVAWWALAGAAISGPITILAGYSDMWRASLAPEVHELVHTHLKIGWTLGVAILGLAIWRWLIRRKPEQGPGGGYLTAAALVFALTMFQGWYGGEMAYAHGVGVAAASDVQSDSA